MRMYSPTHVYYMSTISCNQKCTKCSHWKRKDEADRLPTNKIIQSILSMTNVKELCIVGGEPLLFKSEIVEILKGISDTRVRTTIITNAVLLDMEFIQNVKNFNIHIVISIDTIDRNFWKYVRGVDSYERVLGNLERAITELHSSQISIQSVVAKETLPYIEDVANYAKSKNIYHSVQDYISEGFDGSWTALEQKQAKIPDDGQQCFAAGRNLSIIQNGDVYMCFQQPWIDKCQKPLGNLNLESMNEMLSSDYSEFVSSEMRKCNLPCKVLKCNIKN